MLSLVVGAGGALVAVPSQAAPLPPPEAAPEYSYEAFSAPASGAVSASVARQAATGSSLEGVQGATKTTRTFGSLQASTPEREAALASESYSRGVTYNIDSAELAPRTASSSAEAQRKAPKFKYDFISEKECKRHLSSAGSSIGWTKNHYAWCQIEDIYAFKWKIVNGVPTTVVAELDMRRMVRGEGSRGHRTAKIHMLSYDIVTSDQWANGVWMDSTIECAGSPTWDQCQTNGGQYTKVKTGSTQRANIDITSAVHGSSGRDDKGIGVMVPWTNLYEEARVAAAAGYEQGMRCDSAHYLPAKRGCIFDRVEGTLTYDRKDKEVAAVAKHIYAAQQDPEKTYPKWKGKSVPSKLHRIYYDAKKRKANNRAAVKVCKAEWGADYAESKKNQCDEYPFQSTSEGAAKGDKRFSARVLNADQNGEAGTRLGRWYDWDHILDGDTFHVAIK